MINKTKKCLYCGLPTRHKYCNLSCKNKYYYQKRLGIPENEIQPFKSPYNIRNKWMQYIDDHESVKDISITLNCSRQFVEKMLKKHNLMEYAKKEFKKKLNK